MILEQDSTKKVLCDPYIYTHNAIERLYNEYKKYGSIIIAFDFDYTVHNFKDEQWRYDGVINLLRAWQPYAKLVVFTASVEERYPYIENIYAIIIFHLTISMKIFFHQKSIPQREKFITTFYSMIALDLVMRSQY